MPVSYQSAATSIKTMRARYAGELADTEKRIVTLRAKVQVLDELLQEQAELLAGQQTIPEVIKSDATGEGSSMPSGMTDGIMWVISKHAQATPLSSGEIKEHLNSNGYKATGKNYAAVLTTTLKRLRKTERILGEKINGRWIYRSKP